MSPERALFELTFRLEAELAAKEVENASLRRERDALVLWLAQAPSLASQQRRAAYTAGHEAGEDDERQREDDAWGFSWGDPRDDGGEE